jgi:sterol 3beta-glucosyltransferase
MRIALVTLGTRGDVQPFAALALALRAAGADPVVVTNRNNAGFLSRLGLPAALFDADTDALYGSAEGRAMLARGDLRGLVARGTAWFERQRPAMEAGIAAGIARADRVVSGFLLDDITEALATAQGARFTGSGLAPWPPMRGRPSILVAQGEWPVPGLPWLTHRLAEHLTYGPKRAGEAALRARLGLPPVTRSVLWRGAHRAGAAWLGAWDPALFPRPSGWHAGMQVAGAWRLLPAARDALGEGVPPDLDAWLSDGPPPVFLSFGSLPVPDPARLYGDLPAALRDGRLRVLLAAGRDTDLPGFDHPGLMVLRKGTDHDRVLPRCAAAIHHGGAGTTDSAARAGLPQWALSLFADGPFWGARLAALGTGGHTRFARLRGGLAPVLAPILAALADPSRQAAARALAARMDPDGGAARTARALLDGPPP